MIASTEHKLYQKQKKVGKGSILKSIRIDKGGGKGLIAGAIVLLIFTLPITILGIIADATAIFSYILSAPGILLLVLGITLKRKRDSSWMSYYQETTGFSEGELQQIDRELADPNVTLVVCKTPNAAIDNYIACFLTQHYMVMNGIDPYVRRLEDIIAVAFSDSTDFWSMKCLTTQDKEAMTVGLVTDTDKKAALCTEIMLELRSRNSKILCGQEIVCDGRNYILERDGAELLRLYKEGRPLEPAK
ncbi:MAG: hypothetical protein K2K20_03290 [Lachnospiraceae bacterium]|nr:hypothetical protein [Lachnospiraceae bacterium]